MSENKSTAPILLLCLAALASVGCASLTSLAAPSPGLAHYQAGVEAMDDGDYEQALFDFGEALEADAHLAQAYYARGEVYYLLGQYDHAIEAFSHALTEDYEPAGQAYAAHGDAYNAQGDFTASSQDFAEAYALEGEALSSYLSAWVETYSRAVEQHPELASAYYARGYAGYASDSAEIRHRAITDLSTAIDLGHEPLGPAYFWRASAHYAAADYPQAAEDYSRVIELEPGWPDAYDGRGHAYIRLGQYDLGLADMETGIEVDPDFARGHNNLCWFGSLLGRVNEVMESCERAIALQPNIPAYADSRGLARALTGDYAGAIEDFEVYVEALESWGLEDERRVFWVAELKAGRNPFDEATLQDLLDD